MQAAEPEEQDGPVSPDEYHESAEQHARFEGIMLGIGAASFVSIWVMTR